MDGEADHQQKQERSRTRWTAALDKIFADLIVKHIQIGNRHDNYFDKKTWNSLREEFNGQTNLNFNNNQLRKHLDVLRTRFHNLKSSLDQKEFAVDDSYVIGFDLWDDIRTQPRNESVKSRDCPIYEQLCTIFADSAAEGKYARSSHYEEIDKPTGAEAATAPSPCPDTPAERVSKLNSNKKNKRPLEAEPDAYAEERERKDQELRDRMAKAMMEIVSASKSTRAKEQAPKEDLCSIEKCIRALDEIEGIEERVYFVALDLFEEPSSRVTFMSLSSHEIRLNWLWQKFDEVRSAQTLIW